MTLSHPNDKKNLPSGSLLKVRRPGIVQSIHRALNILNTVARYPEGIGVRELARRVGLKPSTAHAMIKTMAELTYLEFIPERRVYRLGLGAIMLGFGAGPTWYSRISDCIHDILQKFVQDVNESGVVFGFINGLITCIDSIHVEHELSVRRTKKGVFFQIPHYLAGGKVLLAYADTEFQHTYARDKEQLGELGEEFPNAQAMIQHFTKIREQGYAEVSNLLNSGVYALGVPVQGFFGRYDLALGVSLPLIRLTPQSRINLIRISKKYAEEMSLRIKQMRIKMTSTPSVDQHIEEEDKDE